MATGKRQSVSKFVSSLIDPFFRTLIRCHAWPRQGSLRFLRTRVAAHSTILAGSLDRQWHATSYRVGWPGRSRKKFRPSGVVEKRTSQRLASGISDIFGSLLWISSSSIYLMTEFVPSGSGMKRSSSRWLRIAAAQRGPQSDASEGRFGLADRAACEAKHLFTSTATGKNQDHNLCKHIKLAAR